MAVRQVFQLVDAIISVNCENFYVWSFAFDIITSMRNIVTFFEKCPFWLSKMYLGVLQAWCVLIYKLSCSKNWNVKCFGNRFSVVFVVCYHQPAFAVLHRLLCDVIQSGSLMPAVMVHWCGWSQCATLIFLRHLILFIWESLAH